LGTTKFGGHIPRIPPVATNLVCSSSNLFLIRRICVRAQIMCAYLVSEIEFVL